MFSHNALGTFAIQRCVVHTVYTSYILVECTFATNSTAPGFVLIQDEHSQYTINTTLQRHEGDVSKGSVNITDLPTGEYRVTVYDEMEDYVNNIFRYSKVLHLDFIANFSTTFIPSQGIGYRVCYGCIVNNACIVNFVIMFIVFFIYSLTFYNSKFIFLFAFTQNQYSSTKTNMYV